jgi:hypothetical protein
MTKMNDLGLTSTSKASTYQRNRAFEQLKNENIQLESTIKAMGDLIAYLEVPSTLGTLKQSAP